MKLHDTIRKQIREERERQGISTEDLGERLGVTRRTIERLESGRTLTIDVGQLAEIAEILNMEFKIPLSEMVSVEHNNQGVVVGSVQRDLHFSPLADETNALIASQKDIIATQQKMLEQQQAMIEKLLPGKE